MALRKITTSKVYFQRSDRRSSDQLKRHFQRSDFDVLIALINLFDVVMVCMVFDVLFGFRHSDFRSSDLFPFDYIKLFNFRVSMFDCLR